MSRISKFAIGAVLLGGALGAFGCTDETPPPPVRNLDRPTALAFACYGDLRAGGETTVSAQPLESCLAHGRGEVPEGQEDLLPPGVYGFVLQPSRGTLAVIDAQANAVQDNDPLTPGMNDIPVGTLPVDLTMDQSGCFVVTANSGSCDLAAVNVSTVISLGKTAEVSRLSVKTPGGQDLVSKPRAMVAGPQTTVVGNLCPETAEGSLYIAYPECGLVAVVDAATGVAQGGLAFRDDGTIAVATDSDFDCPVQCGDASLVLAHGGGVDAGGLPDGGAPVEEFVERPVVMRVAPDGSALYVAGDSSPFLTEVELDEAGLPTGTIRRIRLEGEVGVTSFAISERIEMGGDINDNPNETIGERQFAYLVATDSTVRVVELDTGIECDTQVDPRYLASVTDVALLSCFPVGGPATPPRRSKARSPGIHLPGRYLQGSMGIDSLAVPLDVAFSSTTGPETVGVSDPFTMVGTFAFITASNGRVFVVNLDDDNYADYEQPGDPIKVSMPLAVAHQLRDSVRERDALATSCANPLPDPAVYGPRLAGTPSLALAVENVSSQKLHELPYLRGVSCQAEVEGGGLEQVVPELAFSAPDDVRERAFPDLRMVESEQWIMTWEGPLSADTIDSQVDGPPVRKGVMVRDAGKAILRDPSRPFCALGAEPYDIAVLLGCTESGQCGVGEECFVHPDTSVSVGSGVCLPRAEVDVLSGPCRDFLISRRIYSVSHTSADDLELVERRRVLRTTPLDGCESDEQCDLMAEVERGLSSDAHPVDLDLPPPDVERSWSCRPDPSRRPGGDRCVMTCEATEDCEAGFHCSSGECVFAPLPPRQCLAAVQRYQVRAGEAFAVIGRETGFLHDLVVDAQSGECVASSESRPDLIGRIPLRAEPCDDDDDPRTGPNPCQTTLENFEQVTPYAVSGGQCVAQNATLRSREVPAIRFSNSAFTFHLVDLESSGDAECRGDRAGDLPPYGAVYPGFSIQLEIAGGFFPMAVSGIEAALPVFVGPGPDGRIWVVDQGDDSSITRGRVYKLNPNNPLSGFDVSVIL